MHNTIRKMYLKLFHHLLFESPSVIVIKKKLISGLREASFSFPNEPDFTSCFIFSILFLWVARACAHTHTHTLSLSLSFSPQEVSPSSPYIRSLTCGSTCSLLGSWAGILLRALTSKLAPDLAPGFTVSCFLSLKTWMTPITQLWSKVSKTIRLG